MKEQTLTVTEYHPKNGLPPEKSICHIITAWLTKELHK